VAIKRTLLSLACGLSVSVALCARPAASADAPSDVRAPTSAPAPAIAPDSAPADGITVHASKKSYDRAIQDFVNSSDAPTRIGQLPRWNDKVCPLTIGLNPDQNDYVSQRIRDLAGKVGARVDDRKSCRPNLLVLFSADPQALLDKVLKTKPGLLGFHYSQGEAKALAVVSHPIQAWYATATQDYHGRVTPDDPAGDWTPTQNPDDIIANATAAEASRLRSGLQSQFSSVLVVGDISKIVGRDLGAVGDYIAVLALTQSKNLDGCRDLPSITELLSPACPDSQFVLQATAADLAYLRSLYSTDSTLFGGIQQGAIATEMKSALKEK
jgi:hypothetical protein